MDPTANGRALPPRPTLLVGKAGDVEACKASWLKLQSAVAELLPKARAGYASTDELDSAVRKFRSLRESLVAAYVRDELAIQVYEASVDLCLVARCWPEYLKSVNGLTADLYPALQDGLQRSAAAGPSTSGDQGTQEGPQADGGNSAADVSGNEDGALPLSNPVSSPSHGLGCSSSGCGGGDRDQGRGDGWWHGGGSGRGSGSDRLAEMHAAHCLFLACGPSGRAADGAAVLRDPGLRPLLGCRELRFAVQVLGAMALGDCFRLLRLREEAPCYHLRALLDLRTDQLRTAGLRCLSGAYRSLPVPAAVTLLRLGYPDSARDRQGTTVKDGTCDLPHPDTRPGPESGSGSGASQGLRQQEAAVVSGLRAALGAAAAGGVRGAQLALDGLSAWEEEEKREGTQAADLVFR